MQSQIGAENLFHSALEDIKNNFFSEAEIKLKKANLESPNRQSIMLNLSSVLLKIEKYDEANKILEQAIKNFPRDADILLNKSLLLILRNEHISAIKVLLNVIRIEPKISAAYYKLANCYSKIGETKKAIKNYQNSFSISPDASCLSNIIFYSNFLENYSDNEYLNLLDKFIFFLPKIGVIKKIELDSKNTNILNIGFVSGDLRNNHPVGNFLYEFLFNLKKHFNLYCYCTIPEDENSKDFKKIFRKWININEAKDSEAINLIKGQQIDILIDLSGHSNKSRLNIFAHKAAPIQITWCGYLNSTGIREIDYIIGDPHVTPLKDQFKYVEKILQMPKIWNCFSKPNYSDIKITNETPYIKNKYITFGSFNQLNKINSVVIKLWSEIILHIKTGKLLFIAPELSDEKVKDRLYKKFFNYGVNKEKIIMKGIQPRNKLLEEYNNIDIALDPFPYNGGSTSFECAFMGVPMLTLQGDRFLSRCGESINKNLSMDNWIAKDKDEYFQKAINFSKDINNLNLIRKNLHNKALNSPLYNCEEFTDDFVKIIKNLKPKQITI
jgi:predicted O-linked N-acetylglucosamine transferase (SPINDLY family)